MGVVVDALKDIGFFNSFLNAVGVAASDFATLCDDIYKKFEAGHPLCPLSHLCDLERWLLIHAHSQLIHSLVRAHSQLISQLSQSCAPACRI